MNASRALAAEQAVALTAGVASDLIGQGGNRGLPKPRFLVAVSGLYGMLGLLASTGESGARFAVASGGVAALTTIVVGPGGKTLTSLLNNLTGLTTPGVGKPASTATGYGTPGGIAPVGGGVGEGTGNNPGALNKSGGKTYIIPGNPNGTTIPDSPANHA